MSTVVAGPPGIEVEYPDDLLEAQQAAETRAARETAAREATEAELAALRQRLGKAPPPGEEDE